MVRLEQRQLIEHAVFALAQGVHATPHRRHPLTDIEVEALDKCRTLLLDSGVLDLLSAPLMILLV